MADIQAVSLAGPSTHHTIEFNNDPLPVVEPDAFDQNSVNPLHDHGEEPPNVPATIATDVLPNTTQTAEPYVSWFGDRKGVGILPQSLLKLWGSLAIFSIVAIVLCMTYVLILLSQWSRFMETFSEAMAFGGGYYFVLVTSAISWSPAVYVYAVHRAGLASGDVVAWLNCIASLVAFGLIAWGYCVLLSKSNASYILSANYNITNVNQAPFGVLLQAWSTGTMPKSFQGCESRVAPQQAALFTTSTYDSQFARTYSTITNDSGTWRQGTVYDQWRVYPSFDLELYSSIRNNQTVCNQGFLGNADLYGLGIRCGIYMQWVSSLLANNFLSNTRQGIQQVYLVFSLAICLAVLISSSTKSCVFGIEIEVLYWMYWGGFVCVFGTAPCSIRLGTFSKWVSLNWTGAILFATHWVMTYHGIWFIWHAYDQIFSRMPCGTYHFFLAPVLDPSKGYWVLRDWLTQLAAPLFPLLLTAFPLVALLLIPEIKYAVQSSATYQTFFRRKPASNHEQMEPIDSDTHEEERSLVQRLHSTITNIQSRFRELCSLPAQRRGGIRLVTPVDVEHRR